MLTYTYVARNTKTNEMVQAEIEAESEKAAAKLLVARGLAPLEITLKAKKTRLGFRNKISTKDKVIFSRQLSTLLNAGLPLIQGLNTVKNQTANRLFQQVVSEIITTVEAGSPLADALAKHPGVFDEVYISLVAAGEASGTLDKSLERLAAQQEKDADVVSKVRGAMVYPIIVIIVLLAIMIFMTTTVLPQVENLYKSLPGASLPFITVWMVGFANVIINFWWIILMLLAAAAFFLRRFLKTDKGKMTIDHLKLNLWPVAPLMKKLYMARFARTSATLVASGVPMIKMLNTAAAAVGNTEISASIHKAVDKVKGGQNLSDALSGDPHFLELVPQMVHVGEQSGALDDMMSKVADYYEKEVDDQIKSISTIIEPAMMILVGIIALIIVAAVLLPIYSLAGKNLGI